ncbi:MAG: hypothetical protein HRU18_01370 [Pseudoalteromonas sp.]|uniref:hypothetical protein n=1 Tax=Pseudoalteromonas sp. TaxID=53249 RepID=UPI001DF2781F|nr:hypothetical protein [Pseudoalteromonas sp.]NRA76830.1 hypothetical protein [Pseudoalteromonas sp.]
MSLFELVTAVSLFCGEVTTKQTFNDCLYGTVECVMEENKKPVICMEEYVEQVGLKNEQSRI